MRHQIGVDRRDANRRRKKLLIGLKRLDSESGKGSRILEAEENLDVGTVGDGIDEAVYWADAKLESLASGSSRSSEMREALERAAAADAAENAGTSGREPSGWKSQVKTEKRDGSRSQTETSAVRDQSHYS
ncbi:predicted protein [Postia placenta Mad-698-R]|uniref:Uncharacterized protein n=1 Tax=Postia placenta MAD-698-R-SB12 TaxID=670580 RepID=A0A1X6MRW2_9APHY|nr:hypothetical protein POSPLADRAFT_1049253 [Postia placenta MAD-698-R-SB12]EED79098.1 predicted protein [Postia placenta Mad-698-R]OSX59124.1 hypothetical protein POSPLADRAFT_1049253 [Postia placenta MAD-698-R-SB12]